jgi:formylmethanofuran dehydrogenase subunit E
MPECGCGIDPYFLAADPPRKGPGFRKVVCARCGKEIYTDIEGKTVCFDCEKSVSRR